MDLHRLVLPYWRIRYSTDLSYEEIGQRLVDNVIIGFRFYSPKRYYGAFTPGGFSARRVWSRIKQMSFAPSVKGEYRLRDGGMEVTLSVTPHPVWLVIFAVVVTHGVLYWLASLPASYEARDPGMVIRSVLPLAVVSVFPWLAFRAQCRTDVDFWRRVLQLREPEK